MAASSSLPSTSEPGNACNNSYDTFLESDIQDMRGTDQPPAMADNDAQWIAAQTKEVLVEHISSGDSFKLVDFPANATVFVDGREYTQGIGHIQGLSPNTVHLVALSLLAPGSRIGFFLEPMDGGHATLRYDDRTVTLLLETGTPPLSLPGLGTHGVAVQTGPGRADWEALARHLSGAVLTTAGAPLRQCVGTLNVPAWPNVRPPPGCTPAERTQFGMDATPRVLSLAAKRYGGRFPAVLGEVQASFLGFLCLGDADALEHWARSLKLLCGCFSLFEDAPEALADFTATLVTQLPFLDTEVCSAFHGVGLTRAVREFWEHFKTSMDGDVIGKWLDDVGDAGSGDEDGPTVVYLN